MSFTGAFWASNIPGGWHLWTCRSHLPFLPSGAIPRRYSRRALPDLRGGRQHRRPAMEGHPVNPTIHQGSSGFARAWAEAGSQSIDSICVVARLADLDRSGGRVGRCRGGDLYRETRFGEGPRSQHDFAIGRLVRLRQSGSLLSNVRVKSAVSAGWPSAHFQSTAWWFVEIRSVVLGSRAIPEISPFWTTQLIRHVVLPLASNGWRPASAGTVPHPDHPSNRC